MFASKIIAGSEERYKISDGESLETKIEMNEADDSEKIINGFITRRHSAVSSSSKDGADKESYGHYKG